jgi:phospholipase C
VPGSTAANAKDSDMSSLVAAFAADVAAGTLPQVSWIVAPEGYSEHPKASPAYGESLTARLLDALTAHPEIWGRTVFIINYDENDGFFDHMPPPLPATDRTLGLSTVSTAGELYEGQAVGLGPRVPLLVVSPWTRGGWVGSQVFDHTSVIRFLEKRFGVAEPNITAWRRAVTGDLTSLFDFAAPDRAAIVGLTETAGYLAQTAAAQGRPPPVVPARQTMPRQEAGQRPARALPYDLAVHGRTVPDRGLTLDFINTGRAGAVFAVYAPQSAAGPWHYTVEAGKRLADAPPGLPISGDYAVVVHGPNGFLRGFAGRIGQNVQPYVEASGLGEMLHLRLFNPGARAVTIDLRPGAYGGTPRRLTLRAGERTTARWATLDGWYDLTVAQADGFERRFAGHIETAHPSRSDPALGSIV